MNWVCKVSVLTFLAFLTTTNLNAETKKIDLDGSGDLSLEEFEKGFAIVFQKLDTNKNNIVDEHESFYDINEDREILLDEWLLQARIRILDSNRDDILSFEEASNKKNLRELFKKIDIDVNGRITKSEVTSTFLKKMRNEN